MRKVELYTGHLGSEITSRIERSSTIFILTSFIMKSGVRLLREALRQAADRDADIKICTGDYLYITQPDALEELIHIHPKIEVRMFRSGGESFHPKAYIFEDGDGGMLFVGSSNLSKSALRNGVEWNLGMQKETEIDTFEQAINEFMKLHNHEQTISVNTETLKLYRGNYDGYHQKHPNLVRNWTEAEEQNLMLPQGKSKTLPDKVADSSVSYGEIQPRFAQVGALEELEKTVEEGFDKSLIIMATGLGKTYLAAFFARRFRRVLFVAHREEILYQAQKSFRNVHPSKKTGIYNGKVKERDVDFLFASIYTLNQKRHLQQFSPNQFDLIVIDEFHHAAANSYRNVLSYFQPQFLLGITATPDRNDNRDIYALCNNRVAYRIDFLEAIQHQWLSPFHYYGVYDDTDYSQIRWLGTQYDEEQLTAVQLRDELFEKTLQAWREHKQTRTLVFCSSIRQARALSEFFNLNGHRTVALHSGPEALPRSQAIRQLRDGEMEAIFTVDLFNEGVDIPSVDTLLFVRPTESLTVFTQQVGRGLRLHDGKEYCVIIDLIGNYRNADVKMSLFQVQGDQAAAKRSVNKPIVPEGCMVDFELAAVNLLDEMARKRAPRREQLLDNYFTVKQDLGRRPAYVEVYQNGKLDQYGMYRQEFKSYVGFLHWAGELSEREQEAFKLYENWLLEVEGTTMTRSYKMVVLQAMLERGADKWFLPITPQEAAPYFHQYYVEKKYRRDKDFSSKNTKAMWEYNERKVSALIAEMPMSKLSGSSKGLVVFEDNMLRLGFDVLPEYREIVWEWTKEICEYRLQYYFFWR
ncbi:DEAD/DEAH box helicase family protein [Ectobacillus ponti]|uniref:DEAD/DEAH box helicase family protein n=1 Tax=Ectobacillus ponti TaxID=2961894 RepID=A0AA41X8G9_9BACI|nr:DEAD/DEAH box helicase family protein [Ectobacillus ponti]MCP8970844.1 DEAD/DEAH box helicase family protein [Ectobacillus ponti]